MHILPGKEIEVAHIEASWVENTGFKATNYSYMRSVLYLTHIVCRLIYGIISPLNRPSTRAADQRLKVTNDMSYQIRALYVKESNRT
jgi:hypothetical protein